MNTADVLNAAADDLEANGWEQGNTGMSAQPPHCLLGAIGAVTDGAGILRYAEIAGHPATRAVADYLGVELDADGLDAHGILAGGVFRWNDDRERTAAEVVEVLRAAALIAAASEVDVTVVEARLP